MQSSVFSYDEFIEILNAYTFYTHTYIYTCMASKVELVVKNQLASPGDLKDVSSIPGSGTSPGGERGNPLQYSCLENSMDRRGWLATVHGVTGSDTTEVT